MAIGIDGLCGRDRASVMVDGGSGEVQEGLNWTRLERLVNWIMKAQRKNAINHCGLWCSEYAWQDSDLRPTV